MHTCTSTLNPVDWCRRTERFCSSSLNSSYSYRFQRFSPLSRQPILNLGPLRGVYLNLNPRGSMAGEGSGSSKPLTAYEEALNCISSLITRRTRADGANKGDNFDLMFDYLKVLELDESIHHLNVIHVAGTKGKGSTCAFTESILRSCGFRTGFFTSPHLIDIRERFRLDGADISEEKFLTYFWWCWDRLQEKADDNMPMPNYFRFLSLLAFKIFEAEKVDVAILEVGLGGKFDATNVVQAPIVCGITSLGYDHMEILGNTLGEIAGEKASIFKQGVPAYSVVQHEEAMSALEAKASQLGISLQLAFPLDKGLLNGQQLGLDGEHQYINAGLAIAMVRTWLQRTGLAQELISEDTKQNCLPEQFIKGVVLASLQGRSQIVPDTYMSVPSNLAFYLDGAHSPESMVVCARWFSHALIKNTQHDDQCDVLERVLLFNCMPVRDPEILLLPFVNTCSELGINFQRAIFAPNQSVFNKVDSHTAPQPNPEQVDISWQLTIQKIWKNINEKWGLSDEACKQSNLKGLENSSVFPSLPAALKSLRDYAKLNRSIRVQVLVTGSLHLVGDLLRLLETKSG